MNENAISRYIAGFDELHILTSASYLTAAELNLTSKINQIADDMLSFLIRAYQKGVQSASEMLAHDADVDIAKMREAIYMVIDGKTFEDRIADHVTAGDTGRLDSLADSEYHRVYNAGVYDGGQQIRESTGLGVIKHWYTVGDDKVRETHEYLEGRTVALDEEFYTFDNDHAAYPGLFKKVENNANCRCTVTLEYDGTQD